MICLFFFEAPLLVTFFGGGHIEVVPVKQTVEIVL